IGGTERASADDQQKKPANPPQPGLVKPFSPTITELWKALDQDELLKQLQDQGLDPKEIQRMRAQFDLANQELRKSWDSFSRVVPYYPAYGRVAVGQSPCSARLGVVV